MDIVMSSTGLDNTAIVQEVRFDGRREVSVSVDADTPELFARCLEIWEWDGAGELITWA